MEKKLWWGYIHTNGNIQVKPFMDKRDISDAIQSPFCEEVFAEFEAESRDDAINYIKKLKENE